MLHCRRAMRTKKEPTPRARKEKSMPAAEAAAVPGSSAARPAKPAKRQMRLRKVFFCAAAVLLRIRIAALYFDYIRPCLKNEGPPISVGRHDARLLAPKYTRRELDTPKANTLGRC